MKKNLYRTLCFNIALVFIANAMLTTSIAAENTEENCDYGSCHDCHAVVETGVSSDEFVSKLRAGPCGTMVNGKYCVKPLNPVVIMKVFVINTHHYPKPSYLCYYSVYDVTYALRCSSGHQSGNPFKVREEVHAKDCPGK